jgi:hypothetical protein
LQEQHLCHDRIGDFVVDASPQKNNAVFEQPAIDVVDTLFTAAFLDDVWDMCHVVRNSVFLS